jgi:hypothetical protein
MVVHLKYGMVSGILLWLFKKKYGPHQQPPRKGPEAHGNENNLLGKHSPRKVPHINKPVMLYV